MSFLRNRRVLLGVAAVLLAVLVAWRFGWLPGRGDAASDKKKRGHEATVPVSAALARVQDVPVTIDAVGTVQALNTVTIRTQVSGKLMKLPFTEGQDVKKGDIVALIEPDPYQAAYDQAVAKKAQDEANLANARIDLVRYQKLAANKYGSEQQFETQKWLVAQLEAQVRSDQGAIDATKTTLNWATIRSPIDGRAGIRLVDVGNILDASNTATNGIIVITQLKPIYVIFTIPQESLPALQRAQQKGTPPVHALGSDNATLIESGAVSAIDNQIDQTTGTAKIRATYANDNLHLWPGQFVNVRVIVDTIKNAIVVPSPAIQRGPNGAFVYVLQDGKAVFRTVTTGQQDEHIAVATSGLSRDEQVVTSGFSRLSNGAKVDVVQPTTGEGGKEKMAAPEGDEAHSFGAPGSPRPQIGAPEASKLPDGGAAGGDRSHGGARSGERMR